MLNIAFKDIEIFMQSIEFTIKKDIIFICIKNKFSCKVTIPISILSTIYSIN